MDKDDVLAALFGGAILEGVSEEVMKKQHFNTIREKSTPDALRELASQYMERPEKPFEVGDLIHWKSEELQDQHIPVFGAPCIVLEVLKTPIRNPHNSGMEHWHLEYDLIVGVIAPNGHMSSVAVQSARFRKYEVAYSKEELAEAA